MKRYLLILISLFFFVASTDAKGRFEWTPDARAAYDNIIMLKLAQAERLIIKIRQEDPENYMVYHLENYVDFFRVFINEDKTQFTRLEQNKDIRLNKIKSGDSSSPYYLYIQADIRLQWALARLKFEEYATAFLETNKAFKLLAQNKEKHPDFMPNKKDLGILYAMVGTIPDNYKWAVEMLTSMEGTIDGGRAELEEVIDYSRSNDFIFETETYVFYSYLMLHLGNEEDTAWRFINQAKHLDHTKNPLAAFIKANVAMRTNRNDEAIQILKNRARGRDYHPFQYLDYMLGLAKLNRLDDDANIYLKRYVNQFRGRNFIKDTYRRLAWHALINDNPIGYYNYMEKVKTKGYTVVGSDGSALKEAKNGQLPQKNLLKARLLFDGGYSEKAYRLLQQYSSFNQKKDQLEYVYRLGRITHDLKRYDEAITYYKKAVEQGRNETWYYACRAALEMGKIYEKLGDKTKAKIAYNDCLSISPNEHKTGLHQGAKAGLSRLK